MKTPLILSWERIPRLDSGVRIQRISLTGFPAQSIGSSNTDVLDLPCLLVLITETSQSRQHVDTVEYGYAWYGSAARGCMRLLWLTESRHYQCPADDIAVQVLLFDIQITSLSPRNCIFLQEVHCEYQCILHDPASEKAVSSKPEPFGYQSLMLMLALLSGLL
ncbi:hypothetical protein Tco_0939734 [Tanacetum coccineum]|uniref:Uncharacterized protein n=1 Tax=Tanacetum coccineum TaxID=301880 RepID=A0ABQ5DS23_9ASTR